MTERERAVLQHREVRKQLERLEHQAHLSREPSERGICRLDPRAGNFYRPAIERVDPDQSETKAAAAEDRALTAPGS